MFAKKRSKLFEIFAQCKLCGNVRRFELTKAKHGLDKLEILGQTYPTDSWTNVTPNLLSYLNRNIYLQKHHPLALIKERISSYFDWKYKKRHSPCFAVLDNISPVVSTYQNFDSLLVPPDHVSRKKSDTFYINENHLLRAHTSAHQEDLLKSGLREFLVFGDCYRRDEIDSTHFPVFHQLEGVRLRYGWEMFGHGEESERLVFGEGERSGSVQESHNPEAVIKMEKDLKDCLEGLVRSLFGQKAKLRWVECYFPFTHPSWELEMLLDRANGASEWIEILGCGIMEQKILSNCAINDQIGWAFGIGLERLAMLLYKIPDIRLFWSKDSGFLSQFQVKDVRQKIVFKPVSAFPQCINDISFWIPVGEEFEKNDFYDLVRNVAGDLVEQVSIIDEFVHPKTKRKSHCYRIVYRHMEKTLTQEEVNAVHEEISNLAKEKFGVEIR